MPAEELPFRNMNRKWLGFLTDLARTTSIYAKMLSNVLKNKDLATNTKCDLSAKAFGMKSDYPEISDAIQEAIFYSETFDEEMSSAVRNMFSVFTNLNNLIKKYVEPELDYLPDHLITSSRSFYDIHPEAENLKRWMNEVMKFRGQVNTSNLSLVINNAGGSFDIMGAGEKIAK
jgi:hypothetical protein